jgi:hypothetical protein
MRMLFSFFEADKQVIVAEPIVLIQYIIGDQYSALSYADLPPIKDVWLDKLRYNQVLKSKRDYLKQHNKTINNYKLKGCRIRR